MEHLPEKIVDQSYYDKARYFQRVIAQIRGLDMAAELIEQAFGIHQTVNAEGAELSLA